MAIGISSIKLLAVTCGEKKTVLTNKEFNQRGIPLLT
jgi:hypothetical protein